MLSTKLISIVVAYSFSLSSPCLLSPLKNMRWKKPLYITTKQQQSLITSLISSTYYFYHTIKLQVRNTLKLWFFENERGWIQPHWVLRKNIFRSPRIGWFFFTFLAESHCVYDLSEQLSSVGGQGGGEKTLLLNTQHNISCTTHFKHKFIPSKSVAGNFIL